MLRTPAGAPSASPSRRGSCRLLLVLLALSGCGDGAVEPLPSAMPAAEMVVLSGTAQEGIVGAELPQPLRTRVLDEREQPIEGQLVNFRVIAGGGELFAGSGLTDADGVVQDLWTLGTSTAEEQVVEARAVSSDGEPVVFTRFTAVALPDAPDTLEIAAGEGQGAQAGQPLPHPLRVRVLDRYGNPVPAVPVTWVVEEGGGTIAADHETGEDGESAAVWTAGPQAGPYRIVAAAEEAGEVRFTGEIAKDGEGDDDPGGTVTVDLGSLGGGKTSAMDIDNHGRVVGSSLDPDGRQRAFLWSAGEGMRDLGGLGDGAAAALAINDAGDVVGWSMDGSGTWVATLWPGGAGAVALSEGAFDPPDFPAPSAAFDINEGGEIVGFVSGDITAFWSSGDAGVRGVCGERGYPAAINDAGTVVGIASTIAGGFLERTNGSRGEYSGFVKRAGAEECRGLVDARFVAQDVVDVNDRGVAVGWGGAYEDAPGQTLRLLTEDVPFLHTETGGFDTHADLPDRPTAINDRGTVVGGDVAGINDFGDRVGGRYLWTDRPDAYPGAERLPSPEGAAADRALAPPTWSLDPSAASLREAERCPAPLARMIRIGALPECPVPDGAPGGSR